MHNDLDTYKYTARNVELNGTFRSKEQIMCCNEIARQSLSLRYLSISSRKWAILHSKSVGSVSVDWALYKTIDST